MKNLGDMMKQVQAMQSKMADMQAKLETATVTGQSGGGLVKVTLTGKGAMSALNVDVSLLKEDEKEILEDLIVAAHADAKAKSEAMMAEEMKSVTGGLALPPGMKLPF
ncbi:MAG TPA: YbaB/EbfC family nucleoid-associated protein [Aestuariivirga sp.]|jgi:DNA-binding YbaB/EbfC family protein|nr:YbaB/EbfC family nucleoid-associated protein [Hyphomicrobiales bacterium]HQX84706.1 YbaB/EbfC family nucleoid-associated protein [Aestuariivirga sp.]MBP9173001.1 YbaB/EbfC family nucleoid-associated protein [Hyphomicrobiales bacterium]MBZ0261679.1 YbaB/EbfC family nucleoid-associated protein [Hyphomicrobiales bacterium]MCC7482417.1 YbaB/EbfC family nucleoid-associated protein [Hyphomicrobiales bacterium]